MLANRYKPFYMRFKRQLSYILTLLVLMSCNGETASNDTSRDASTTLTNDTIINKSNDTENDEEIKFDYENPVFSLGKGLIITPTEFELYNDSLLTEQYVSLDMYKDENEIDFYSKFFSPEYGIMHFVCVDKSEKAFKVVVNHSDIKFLPITNEYIFETWNKYILESLGIRRNRKNGLDTLPDFQLRERPDINSNSIEVPEGFELFCPFEINGDWVNVKYDCFYNDDYNIHEGKPCHEYIDDCSNPLTGWIRWKKKNQLLIDIFLMP
jgi:hypothetical protein